MFFARKADCEKSVSRPSPADGNQGLAAPGLCNWKSVAEAPGEMSVSSTGGCLGVSETIKSSSSSSNSSSSTYSRCFLYCLDSPTAQMATSEALS